MNKGVEIQMDGPESLDELFEPKEWPGTIGLWRIALQVPEAPTHSRGGIELPEEYQEDHKFATYIGNVRAIGALAFKATTNGGVSLEDDPGLKIGDWVMVDKHAGRKFRMVDRTLWIIISDTQYLSKIDQPELFECMAL